MINKKKTPFFKQHIYLDANNKYSLTIFACSYLQSVLKIISKMFKFKLSNRRSHWTIRSKLCVKSLSGESNPCRGSLRRRDLWSAVILYGSRAGVSRFDSCWVFFFELFCTVKNVGCKGDIWLKVAFDVWSNRLCSIRG